MNAIAYSALMGEQPAHLTLKLDTDEPIELADFVGAFTSIANEFERYVSEQYPGTKADPRMDASRSSSLRFMCSTCPATSLS